MKELDSKSVGATRFVLRYDPEWSEYSVSVSGDSKRAYYTDDKQDAFSTMGRMIEEEAGR